MRLCSAPQVDPLARQGRGNGGDTLDLSVVQNNRLVKYRRITDQIDDMGVVQDKGPAIPGEGRTRSSD